MDIYEIINMAQAVKLQNNINFNQHMRELSSRDYDFLYKELKYKKSYYFVDKELEFNLVMKIDSEKQIEEVVKSRKIISISRDVCGPVIEMNMEGLINPFTFIFDLSDDESLCGLKILMNKREARMHFVLDCNDKLTKIFSALLNVDDRIFERLRYAVNLSWDGGYPYIEYLKGIDCDSKNIEVEYNESLLDELVNIIDNLQRWGSRDSFSILLKLGDSYKITFEGNMTNFNYIKNELRKRFEIIGESESNEEGIPFLKYDRGMIYFYKTGFSKTDE